MSLPRYADLVRRLVRQARTEPTPSVPSDKRRLVSAVEEALRVRARRQATARRAGRVALSAVALAMLFFGAQAMLWNRSADLQTEHVAQPSATRSLTVLSVGADAHAEGVGVALPHERLGPGMSLDRGFHLVAPASSEVRFGSSDGTVLSLEPRGELTVTDASAMQRFSLRTGAVRARVAHLRAGDRFVIDTIDAEVEVHGTEFRVAVVKADPACGDGTTTRVSVNEGVVSVRARGQEARVLPGQTWPASCEPSPVVASPVVTIARALEHAHRAAGRPHVDQPASSAKLESAVSAVPSAPLVDSELRAQNDLFSAAVRAKNQGQAAEAARLFGRILVEYPGSPLVEGATVQRMKVLSIVDAAAGARAAADYLARYPSGFARPDATKLLSRSAP